MAFTGRQPGRSVGVERLIHARDIALAGDVYGSTSFDATANVSIDVTIQDDSHNHIIDNVDGLQTALDTKAPIANLTTHTSNTSNPHSVTKTQVGLGSVDNTADVNKPISTATQTALNLKAPLASPTFTGTVVLPSTTSIGNIDATEISYLDGVTSAIQTQLNAKVAAVSSTDNAIVRFNGTGGAVQNSGAFIDDNGNLTANNIAISSSYPSIRPSLLLDFANTKRLDPRITFSRPTTATYYDGKTTAKAEENLLPYSQEFDNAAWSKQGTSITANSVSAPYGTNTADTLTADGTTNQHIIWCAPSSGGSLVRVLSIYAKAGTNNYFQLMFGIDVNAYANFDLSNGTVGTVGSSASTTITSVGNGWYRCSIYTASATASAAVYAVLVTSATASRYESNTLATGIYLWGAQLEQRSSVTAYTPTTSSPITNYIPVLQTAPANAARFDHNPVTGESKGLLIEGQRTNLLTYSEQFDNAAWTKHVVTATANAVIAPDGTLTGEKISENVSTSTFYAAQSLSIGSGTTYTLTVYAKEAQISPKRYLSLLLPSANFGLNFRVTFDLAAGTYVTSNNPVSASMVSVGGGWYRCQVTATATVTGSGSLQCRIANVSPDTLSPYTGDGTSGIYIWGAQLEAGSFATSYIPTTSAQVTRSADSASMTGTNFSSWYRADEGTMYAEASTNQTSFTVTNDRAHIVTLHSEDNQNLMETFFSNTGVALLSRNNGTFSAAGNVVSGTTFNGVFNKVIYNFSGIEASQVAMDGTLSSPLIRPFQKQTINQLLLGNSKSSSNRYLDGHIKKVAFYPKALTAAELQTMTA